MLMGLPLAEQRGWLTREQDGMKRFLFVLAGLVAGYFAGALAGYFGTFAFSPNKHDLALEAAMSSAFVYGPAGSILGAIAGFFIARKPPAS